MNNSRSRIEEEEEDDKMRLEHSGNIIKNNGWNCIDGFLDSK